MQTAQQLREAVAAGDVATVRRLAVADPALAMMEDEPGMSILLKAQYDDQAALVEALLAGDPSLGMFEAAALGQSERVAALLAQQPGLARAYAPDGFTPLHVAAHFCHPRVVAVLLERGADPNAVTRNDGSVTPLHSGAAPRRGEHGEMMDIVGRLLEHGADVNAQQAGGFTVLHTAARRGDRALVQLLLAHGADPGVLDGRGADARDHARRRGHLELLELLG
jgi:ankyrin repeat protein